MVIHSARAALSRLPSRSRRYAPAGCRLPRTWSSPIRSCTLPLVPDGGLHRATDYALCNTFGFGGINACLVLARPEE